MLAQALGVALAGLIVASPSATVETLRTRYDAAIALYRERPEAGVEAFVRWPREDAKTAAADLKRRVTLGGAPVVLRAAILLHTETSFAFADGGLADEGAAQLRLARELLETNSHLPSAAVETSPSFECSWWLAVGYHYGAGADALQMADSYGEADRACGTLPEFWLARGALAEFLFTFGFPRNADGERLARRGFPQAMLVGGHQDYGSLAAIHYRRALAVDAQLWEAHLRLARCLMTTGRPDEADAELRAVLAGSRDPAIRYLAYLFLGDIAETRGRRDEAVARYRLAVKIGPGAGSASIALARFLLTSGEPIAARTSLLAYLGRDPAAEVADPWIAYSTGVPIDGLERALERLRAVVRVAP